VSVNRWRSPDGPVRACGPSPRMDGPRRAVGSARCLTRVDRRVGAKATGQAWLAHERDHQSGGRSDQHDRRQECGSPRPASVPEPTLELDRPRWILLRRTGRRRANLGLERRRRTCEYCARGRRRRAGDAHELLGVAAVPEIARLEGQPVRAVALVIGSGRCWIHPVERLDAVAGHPGEQDYIPVILPRTVVCRPCQGGVFPPEPLSYP
jgi:hypothetical protein